MILENTYGIQFSLRVNTEKKAQLLNYSREKQKNMGFQRVIPKVIKAPEEIEKLSSTESCLSEREELTEEQQILNVKSKPIKKEREYKICSIPGCSRSYCSEKRYKKHLLQHLKNLFVKVRKE
eukprot:TRINITY_DN3181_c0_g1_i3.p1 TRINITY_DN3181_c0_g1~~TRINITY_DN3181_c0_g1_i3.p1  ORF type:complete len:123 (-),score=25.52 TRINITY_DN3181_c0_g1_i3:157-525(-)